MLNRFRIDGKIALITGAAQGIGKATCRWLQDAGATVVALDRDGETLAALKHAHERHILDVSNSGAIRQTFGNIAQTHGQIDILVNCAGINRRRPALDCEDEDWQAVININVNAVFACAREAARHMPKTGGSIINLASIMGFSGGGLYPNTSYATSKGAIVNMTRALAVEWAPKNIRTNAVAPTWTRTNFIQPLLDNPELTSKLEAMTPLGKLAEPDDVAAAILFLVSPAASMITGHTLAVDGGFLAQ